VTSATGPGPALAVSAGQPYPLVFRRVLPEPRSAPTRGSASRWDFSRCPRPPTWPATPTGSAAPATWPCWKDWAGNATL